MPTQSFADKALFNDALGQFLEAAQKLINEHFAKKFPSLKPDLLSIEPGRKYVRVVKTSDDGHGQRSVFCFINQENGDILKAASWKAPAAIARGNIYKSSTEGINVYGADYR
jgi:hypothetical protein